MEFSSISPKVIKFASVLSLDDRFVYEIPKYQREYSWKQKDWEALFDDLNDNDEGYFLGSIICINAPKVALDVPRHEVVDGQQRLVTLSLLLAALYTILKPYKECLNDSQWDAVRDIEKRLVLTDSKSEIRVIPQIQNNNKGDYTGLLSEIGVISKRTMPLNAGNRRIKKAYNYFVKRINAVLNSNPNNVNLLFELLKKVNSACFVVIVVSTHKAAYILFESLNNRGTPLSSVDLIKNLLLGELDTNREGENSIDKYYERWMEILENLGEEDSERERFFRQNYNAFRKTFNERFKPDSNGERKYPLGTIATRSTMLDIYERIITKAPVAALEELSKNAEIYAGIILNKTDNLSDKQREAYLDLHRVQGAPSYLLIMYLLKRQEALGMTDDDIVKICKLLVNFFVRRNLTDTPPTRDLTRIFMSFIETVEQYDYHGEEIYTNLRNTLISQSASDEFFEEKLRGQVYEDNVGATRFILCMMAKRGMTRENEQDLWRKTDSNQYVWSIEHIFPQGPNIPECWVDMIADGDSEKAKEYQSLYVHTFGNLTITGYNSNLSNKPFHEKKERKDNNGHYIGYRNGLNLNEDVCDKDKWTVEIIQARTNRMVKEIMEMFAL